MPKVLCKCGNIILLNEIPNEHEYLYISDAAYEALDDNCQKDKIYAEMNIAVKCDSCQRIYLYGKSLNSGPLIYKPDID